MNEYEEYEKARAEGKEYLELLPHETDESMGTCDVCQAEYETGSQIDHCGECGTCWNHCVKHEPYGVKDDYSLHGIKKGYEDHA